MYKKEIYILYYTINKFIYIFYIRISIEHVIHVSKLFSLSTCCIDWRKSKINRLVYVDSGMRCDEARKPLIARTEVKLCGKFDDRGTIHIRSE